MNARSEALTTLRFVATRLLLRDGRVAAEGDRWRFDENYFGAVDSCAPDEGKVFTKSAVSQRREPRMP